MHIRKERAGSSHSHEWPYDGAIVEVPDDHGRDLLAIPDGGFTEMQPGELPDEADPVIDEAPAGESGADISEAPVDGPAALDEAPAPSKTAAKNKAKA